MHPDELCIVFGTFVEAGQNLILLNKVDTTSLSDIWTIKIKHFDGRPTSQQLFILSLTVEIVAPPATTERLLRTTTRQEEHVYGCYNSDFDMIVYRALLYDNVR